MIIYNKLIGGENMDKEFYINNIEKSAAAKDKVINILNDNKSYLSALGAGAGALGGAYLFSDKDDRQKIKDGYKDFKSKKEQFSKNHKLSKSLLRGGGALAGTAMALKSGKPLGKAIGSGGIAGTAIGDIIGSSALPVKELYKEHKKEFGTNPDTKDVLKVLGANALPTAALWGGVYGLKNGAIKKDISKNINDGVNNAIKGKGELVDVFNKFNGNQELINSVGKDVLEKQINEKVTKILEGGLSVPLAMMPIGFARQTVASIPGSYINPKSLIKKKKEIEDKSINK